MALSEAEELELLELEEEEAKAKSAAPEDKGPQGDMNPLDYERSPEYPTSSYTSLGPTLEVMQAPFIAKDVAMLAVKSPALIKGGVQALKGAAPAIRTKLSEYLSKKAGEAYFDSLGATVKQATELGPEGQAALGRFAKDKDIIGFGRSSEDALKRTIPYEQQAGKSLGALRDTADFRAIGEGAQTPTVKDLATKAEAELAGKYRSGAEAAPGELDRALEELYKAAPVNKSSTGEEVAQAMDNVGGGLPANTYDEVRALQEGPHPELYQEFPYLHDKPTFTEMFDTSTRLNKAAENLGSVMQPHGATTDVANVVARTEREAIQPFLDPAEKLGYQESADVFGKTKKLQKMLGREQARGATGGETPFSKHAIMDKFLSPQSRGVMMDKVSEMLKVNPQAFGKASGPLLSAMGRGRAALASTIFVLQQQDPEFREQAHSLMEGGR